VADLGGAVELPSSGWIVLKGDLGTWTTRAPEQWGWPNRAAYEQKRPQAHERLSLKADVYSFGCVLAELFLPAAAVVKGEETSGRPVLWSEERVSQELMKAMRMKVSVPPGQAPPELDRWEKALSAGPDGPGPGTCSLLAAMWGAC